VKNRTSWGVFDENLAKRIGVHIGDDIHELNLDLSLETFIQTREHLSAIPDHYLEKHSFVAHELMQPMVRMRLVEASGGVARDFLNLFCGTAEHALGRAAPKGTAEDKIIVKDVYEAVAKYTMNRMSEFRAEMSPKGYARLQKLLERITKFCLGLKVNHFLVPLDASGLLPKDILSLMDLKGIHLVRRALPVRRNLSMELHTAFMLDLSATAPYRHSRKVSLLKLADDELEQKIAERRFVFRV
jgi:hypothetical protein